MSVAGTVTSHVRRLLPDTVGEAIPGVAVLREYERASLRPDLVAGAIVAVVAVPSALAMGELGGVPVVFGLYAAFLPLVGYALFGSSRHLVIGPDATLATLTATTVAPLAVVDGVTDPARYAALASALALTMGAVLFLAGTVRLGFVADFFGKPVLLGYINGIALTIIAGQLGKMFGLDIDSDDFFAILWEFVSELDETSRATVALSALLLASALAVRRFPRVPAPVVVLLAGLLAGSTLDVDELGISVVGEVEQGLPPLGVPDLSAGDYVDVVLPAIAFALVVFADGIATVRTFALKHGYEVDPNAELRGFGASNLLAGVSSAIPVSSSGSRTAVNDSSGGRTQVMSLAAVAVVGLFLLFLMPLIEPLPKAALGVIVVVAALGLFDVRAVWRLRHVRPAEVALALSALVGVLVFGVVGGIAVAIMLSIGVFLYRSARPHDAVLGSVEDLDGYHDIERWENAQVVPGLIVYRFDATPFSRAGRRSGMSDVEEVRARLRNQADREFAPAWRPEQPGDELAGTITSIRAAVPTQHGPVPVVELVELGSERAVALWLIHTVLRNEFGRARPAVGETVLVRYLGRVQPDGGGPAYESYRVVVDRPDEGSDVAWGAIAGGDGVPAGEQPVEDDYGEVPF